MSWWQWHTTRLRTGATHLCSRPLINQQLIHECLKFLIFKKGIPCGWYFQESTANVPPPTPEAMLSTQQAIITQGLLSTKTFYVPHFLFLGNGPFSLHHLPWVPGDRSDSCSSEKKGDTKTREEQLRNNSTGLGARSQFPLKGHT